jgi:hypothetical protein
MTCQAYWRHPSVTSEQRKALVRRVIKNVWATPDLHSWTITIEWVGGARTISEFLTIHGVQAELGHLIAHGLTVPEMVEQLNRQGIVQMSGKTAGKPYTQRSVRASIRWMTRRGGRLAQMDP